jgi:hypothetical protein
MDIRLETEVHAKCLEELNMVIEILENEGWICGNKEEVEFYAYMVRFI